MTILAPVLVFITQRVLTLEHFELCGHKVDPQSVHVYYVCVHLCITRVIKIRTFVTSILLGNSVASILFHLALKTLEKAQATVALLVSIIVSQVGQNGS